jgi:glucosylceramidase
MIKIIESSRGDSHWLHEKEGGELSAAFSYDQRLIRIDPKTTYQTYQGMGGALTEAAASVLSLMSEKQKEGVLRSYFAKEGAHYHWARLSINSCDFALGNYDYLQGEDQTLKSFSLEHEDRYLFPALKQIQAIRSGESLAFMASPWSPCAFMKDNHDMNHGGHLLKEFYPLWADYLALYVKKMAERGIAIDVLTLQNEPEANQTWDSCLFSAQNEAEFVPFLRKALDREGFRQVQIFIWDHNRDEMVRRANVTLQDPAVDQIVDGVAFHWYCSDNHANVELTHILHPKKHLYFSEGCVELVNKNRPDLADSDAYAHGEIYGKNISEDFNHYCEAWIDWNIVCDERGGPNHVGNFCEAPVMFDRAKKEITYNPSYYYLVHFSRYIPLGSVRLDCRNDFEEKVYSVAFKTPKGDIVAVLQNQGDAEKKALLLVGEKGTNIVLKPHSIATYLIKE